MRTPLERRVALDPGRVPLPGPPPDLALQVAGGTAELAQADRLGVHGVQVGQHVDQALADRAALRAYLAELGPLDDDTPLYRVELHHGGDGDRVELALEATLTAEAVAAITTTLARLDRPTADRPAPWTAATLALIDARPRVAASQLAAALGRETLPFKTDVRKLKRLGLTQSFEVGYEIAPRGRAYLAARAPGRRAGTPATTRRRSRAATS